MLGFRCRAWSRDLERRFGGRLVYVSDLTPISSQNGWGPFEERSAVTVKTQSADGHTITLNGQVYSKGLGTNATSDIRYSLAGTNYSQFLADVGVDDEVGSNGTVDFQVWLDSNKVFWTAGR